MFRNMKCICPWSHKKLREGGHNKKNLCTHVMSYSEVIDIITLNERQILASDSHFVKCKFREIKCNICQKIVINGDKHIHRSTCRNPNDSTTPNPETGETPGRPAER
jgi:hypothetical protein